jgi:ABC-type Zn uptake system ZnuABC Zn-binding protein ZnuA
MKKIIITFISVLVFASLSLTACNSIPQTTLLPTKAVQSDSDLIKVLAIESFLADIAQNVAGDRLRVETLIPIGTDPHAFEPTPQDVAKIADSQVLIANGAGLEEWLAKMVTNVGGERTIIEAAAGLTSREGEEAVMSPEEKSESICTQLGELTAEEEIMTGADVANAVEMHTEHKTEAAEIRK